ncbi:hypothetical protein LCGC14_0882710 [marine sediment metagenome]|uniref:Uncharacterized protein n=1 Tax=marine sediment metagenome TaxID=412755 RepID=A0A0F9S8E0_9ZZZZ
MRLSDEHLPDLGQKVIIDHENAKNAIGFVFGILYRYGGIGPLVLVDRAANTPEQILTNAQDCIKVGPSALLKYPTD